MIRSTSVLVAVLAALIPLAPVAAQDGAVSMAHFAKVAMADVFDFEQAVAEHNQWHADRNDPWTWSTYQAMTGDGPEYVTITPEHDWADFDDPPVDMAADLAHVVEVAGEYFQSMESVAWVPLPELSNMPPGPSPVVQVFEWDIVGNEEAVLHIVGMYKEAVDEVGAGRPFTWYRTISNDGPPRIFIAVSFDSFAQMDAEGPDPLELMARVHGQYAMRQAAEAAGSAWRSTGSQIWVYRPDLSYDAGM